MAWTDACKIEAVAQVDHKVEQGLSVRKALKELAEESGIPAKTIERWKYPAKSVPKNEDTKKKEPKPISQKQAWKRAIKQLKRLSKFFYENQEEIENLDDELFQALFFHMKTAADLTTPNHPFGKLSYEAYKAGNPIPKYQRRPKIPKDLEHVFAKMREEVAVATPKWFSKAGLKRKSFESTVKALDAGKWLGCRQEEVFDTLLEIAKELKSTGSELTHCADVVMKVAGMENRADAR